ncbi:hypothetical protein PROFUN_03298 [Planoprotostelium fungivorum]|uniref:Uncharacterized protein n=1 Tax=Planoprotostelium fungivorum TaxID=1890364 RepID=A0A2P6NWP3_9EUKA|nr:hypothetical protein PROFUN_03298 [Planoprotostelium fungivorum]
MDGHSLPSCNQLFEYEKEQFMTERGAWEFWSDQRTDAIHDPFGNVNVYHVPTQPYIRHSPVAWDSFAPPRWQMPTDMMSAPFSTTAPTAPMRDLEQMYPLMMSYEEQNTSKKRKMETVKPRNTRPKVEVDKGAVQCIGYNRKRKCQCRNAALKEYIGPAPQYCAEHIELDPNSLYQKCMSPYHKNPEDRRRCKEVVLKEFKMCYKHFGDLCSSFLKDNDVDTIQHLVERTTQLHHQLEIEANSAKKMGGDLYQRKIKLLPKFAEMKSIATKTLESCRPSSSQSELDQRPESSEKRETPIEQRFMNPKTTE